MSIMETTVLIIGAGPAGLAAAQELTKQGKKVIVIDREKFAGGFPRYCHHQGFGLRDVHFSFSGPSYSAHYVKKSEKLGIKILTETTAISWEDDNTVLTSSPNGLAKIKADAILIATGCREKPRAARLVPGSRPFGVYTTGSLQDFVHEYHKPVGNKVVIVGAELVSLSAIATVKKAKGKVKCLVTEHEKHQAYFPYSLYKFYTATLNNIPVYTKTKLTNIIGNKKIEAVEILNLQDNTTKTIDCDALVFTGGWIPDHEFSRLGGLEIDPFTNGPSVDNNLKTSKKGVFAAGNVLRGAETADIAALEGKFVAQNILNYLDSKTWEADTAHVDKDESMEWVFPQQINTNDSSRLPLNCLMFRVNHFIKNANLKVYQKNKLLYSKEFNTLGPNLSFKVKGSWLSELSAEPITFKIN